MPSSQPGRIAPHDALTLARRLLAREGRPYVCRLLRDERGSDFSRVDDAQLARWLSLAIAGGRVDPQGEDESDRPEAVWVAGPDAQHPRALLTDQELFPGMERLPVPDLASAMAMVARMLEHPTTREHLLAFTADGEDEAVLQRRDDADLLARCARMLFDRHINLFRSTGRGDGNEVPMRLMPRPSPVRSDSPTESAKTSEHWIEIVLVDEDGEPIASEPYQLTLPNGDVRKGRLDDKGRAKLTGLKQAGRAKVMFPKIDKREWKVA